MSNKDAFPEELIMYLLQESERNKPFNQQEQAEQEQLEELMALYHLSALGDASESQALEPMPDELLDKVEQQGNEFVERQREYNNVVPIGGRKSFGLPLPQRIAMAACLLLAMVAWYPKVIEQLKAPASLEQQVATFEQGVNTLVLDWQKTEDPAAKQASGKVSWSQNAQKGYMHFSGLEANNPEEYQYQLWIFDKSRDGDQSPAVDGGVFDIASADNETIVPINAKLDVDKPYLFAVTIEKPGGVVVSNRERIVVLAKNGA